MPASASRDQTGFGPRSRPSQKEKGFFLISLPLARCARSRERDRRCAPAVTPHVLDVHTDRSHRCRLQQVEIRPVSDLARAPHKRRKDFSTRIINRIRISRTLMRSITVAHFSLLPRDHVLLYTRLCICRTGPTRHIPEYTYTLTPPHTEDLLQCHGYARLGSRRQWSGSTLFAASVAFCHSSSASSPVTSSQ